MDEIGSATNIVANGAEKSTEKNDGSVEFTTTVPKGHRVESTIVKDNVKPAYIMVGNGNLDRQKKGTHSMDYTKELLNMTKPEGFMFAILMENRENPTLKFRDHSSAQVRKQYNPHYRSNQTYIDNSKLTKTQKKYITEAYKKLREKDLIVRTKREHYIINPRLVISNYDWVEDERLYIEAVEKLTNAK